MPALPAASIAACSATAGAPEPRAAPQLLLVVEGRGLLQKWGEPVRRIGAGDAITIEPNEKHWHGAAPDSKMSHFAVNLNLTTEWLEPVADDQYRAS